MSEQCNECIVAQARIAATKCMRMILLLFKLKFASSPTNRDKLEMEIGEIKADLIVSLDWNRGEDECNENLIEEIDERIQYAYGNAINLLEIIMIYQLKGNDIHDRDCEVTFERYASLPLATPWGLYELLEEDNEDLLSYLDGEHDMIVADVLNAES